MHGLGGLDEKIAKGIRLVVENRLGWSVFVYTDLMIFDNR